MSRSDRLDPEKISTNLKTRRIGRQIVVYDSTSSTNDVAAEYARKVDNDGLVVFAEQQTAGRGRNGAVWHSAHGDSLLLSVLLTRCNLPGELLSLTCAVAIAEGLGTIGRDSARVKWPNDIVLEGKKIGGILLECRHTQSGPTHIVGIGINCHQRTTSFPNELREIATSIDLVSGRRCDRPTLARRLLTSLDNWLQTAGKDRKHVIEAWRALSTQLGQRLTLRYNGRTFAGHCIGVDPQKGLIVQLDRGGVRMFDASHSAIVRAQSPAGTSPK